MRIPPGVPNVGDRLLLTEKGEEVVVNRITPTHQNSRLVRLQIDCMSVAEVEYRRDNLIALLAGEAERERPDDT